MPNPKTRSEFYAQFGPLMLEAIVEEFRKEINKLRVLAGLSEKDEAQFMDKIGKSLKKLEKHDWMKPKKPKKDK